MKVIASLSGQLISMELAVGHAVNFHTRCLYQAILLGFNRHSCILISSSSIVELKLRRENLSISNSHHIRVHRIISELNVYSDAFDTGYGKSKFYD